MTCLSWVAPRAWLSFIELDTAATRCLVQNDIGKWGAGFLVLNCVIGAGIYGLPGALMDMAGIFSPWLFIIFGVLISTVVLTFAVLASYFSGTGGPILYASSAFGPIVGFQTGWLLYMGRVAGFAANLNVLFDYAAYLWNGASAGLLRNIMIFLVIALLTVINILGIKKAIQALNILTFFKTIPLIVMMILGFQYLTPETLLPHEFPKIDDTSALVLLILYAFVGFESSLVSAGETQNPKKNNAQGADNDDVLHHNILFSNSARLCFGGAVRSRGRASR